MLLSPFISIFNLELTFQIPFLSLVLRRWGIHRWTWLILHQPRPRALPARDVPGWAQPLRPAADGQQWDLQSVEVEPYCPTAIVCLNSTYLSNLRKQKLGIPVKTIFSLLCNSGFFHLSSPFANYFEINYRFILSVAWKQDMGLNYMVIILKWHSYCIPVCGTRCFHPILCIELIRVLGNYGQSPNLGHLSGVELVPGVSLFPHLLIPLDSADRKSVV